MPSDPRSLNALFDIRDCIAKAQKFSDGLTFEQFREDEKTYHATTRMLEIISEASRRLSSAIRDRHPGIPWRDVQDAGNFYRHQYDNVAEQAIWLTVRRDLPPLLAIVLTEIEYLKGQG